MCTGSEAPVCSSITGKSLYSYQNKKSFFAWCLQFTSIQARASRTKVFGPPSWKLRWSSTFGEHFFKLFPAQKVLCDALTLLKLWKDDSNVSIGGWLGTIHRQTRVTMLHKTIRSFLFQLNDGGRFNRPETWIQDIQKVNKYLLTGRFPTCSVANTGTIAMKCWVDAFTFCSKREGVSKIASLTSRRRPRMQLKRRIS